MNSDEIKSQIKTLEMQVADAQQKHAAAEKTAADQKSRMEADINAYQQKADGLKSYEGHESEVADFENRVATHQSQLEQAMLTSGKTIQDTQANLDDLQRRLDAAKADLVRAEAVEKAQQISDSVHRANENDPDSRF